MIEVNLPGKVKGSDVIEVFSTVATFQIDENHRWKAFVEPVDYVHTTQGNLEVVRQQVVTVPLKRSREFFVLGKKRDYECNASITLQTIDLREEYTQVLIDVFAKRVMQDSGYPTTDDPMNELFEQYRNDLGTILAAFGRTIPTFVS